MVQITSPHNPRILKIQQLHTTRGRKKSGLFLLEGPHLLEVLLEAQLPPLEIYYQPELLERTPTGRALLGRIKGAPLEAESLVEVSERVIEALGDAQTSQGVVSIAPLALFAPERLLALRPARNRPILLVLDGLADPGNMGTILRTALAADADAVCLTPASVDIFSPKVVRAAAGAHMALPIFSHLAWSDIKQRALTHAGAARVFLAEAGCERYYYAEDLSQPFTLIIGNEARGPSREARELATQTITIPLANNVESLNAAMAAGIILYESVRQRQLRP